ncbi:MAG TPA: C39 family peptidase [Rectinemataceae bacterium]|nr:C39 family peptidase [Rectinemataceae bacterium]
MRALLVLLLAAASSLFAQTVPRDSAVHLLPDVPYHGQRYTEDCETAALQMALAHEGIRASQDELLRAEGISLKAPVLDAKGRVLRWGNPDTSFVGHPDSASISTAYGASSGYGTYAPNIARVAARFGGTVLRYGSGLTRSELEKAIEDGHPVIAWVGDRAGHMRWAPLARWRAWDGKLVGYPAPSSGVYEHCVLVTGWSGRGVYVLDPLDGARNGSNRNPVVGPGWVSWDSFLAGFRTFNGMAVVMR